MFFSRYLCGPNTTVYDTVAIGCNYLYVNAGCTLFFKLNCSNASSIWVKNNGILNVIPGIGSVQVYYEPLAVINNTASSSTILSPCPSITLPTVICTQTGIKENNYSNDLEIYPNPASDKLNILFTSGAKEFIKAQIVNSIGQVVKEIDLNNKTQINIEDLPNGVYLLNLKSTNSTSISKRFIIAR
ncbi:MAG: T9SS type A sorting domain-containing protein [Bacteroidota bacterium]|nr:T9SS type A sorting domain-containing protein [Bacteroidota bacterium]